MQGIALVGQDLLVADNRIDGGHRLGIDGGDGGNRHLWIVRNRVSALFASGLSLTAGEALVAVDNELVGCGSHDDPPVAASSDAVVAGTRIDGVAGPDFSGAPLALDAPATIAEAEDAEFGVRFADGTVVAHALWDVGDGPALVGTRIRHAFAAGRHRVAVLAWDESGRVGMAQAEVAVGP